MWQRLCRWCQWLLDVCQNLIDVHSSNRRQAGPSVSCRTVASPLHDDGSWEALQIYQHSSGRFLPNVDLSVGSLARCNCPSQAQNSCTQCNEKKVKQDSNRGQAGLVWQAEH